MSEPFERVNRSYCEDLKELMPGSPFDQSHAFPHDPVLLEYSKHTFAKFVASCPEVPLEVPPDPRHDVAVTQFIKAPRPPLPTQGDWTNLFQPAKNFCPCNMAGHRCAGLDLCDKIRICNQAKNRRRILNHLRFDQPHCQIPDQHHIMATCGHVKKGEPCPDFNAKNCLYGHDHLATRLQLWNEHKAHHDYFYWKNDSRRN